ncbi:MAG: tetratricopeptide repeat protein, partial [Polaromonas sp.]|nr:tetratricopeptide repeat protein [Polaromonas sp.]
MAVSPNLLFTALKQSAASVFRKRKIVDVSTDQTTKDHPEIIKQANAAVRSEDFSAAVGLYAKLADAKSKNPDIYISYGYSLLKVTDFSRAKAVLKTAIELAPESADAHYMLGKACIALNDHSAAETAWVTSHRLSPKIESLYCDLCLLLFTVGKVSQARSFLKSGIENFPLNSDLYFYLGNLDAENADYAEAAIAYQKAIDLDPTSPHLLSNYGTALRQIGNLTLSTELTKKALELAPEIPSIFSNYLFGIQYSPAFTKEEKFKAHLEYAEKFETPFLAKWGNYKNDTNQNRKIRIGYVSGDFRNHSLIFFIAPILANHDKSRFEIYCYYAHPLFDADSERIKKMSDQWLICH